MGPPVTGEFLSPWAPYSHSLGERQEPWAQAVPSGPQDPGRQEPQHIQKPHLHQNFPPPLTLAGAGQLTRQTWIHGHSFPTPLAEPRMSRWEAGQRTWVLLREGSGQLPVRPLGGSAFQHPALVQASVCLSTHQPSPSPCAEHLFAPGRER